MVEAVFAQIKKRENIMTKRKGRPPAKPIKGAGPGRPKGAQNKTTAVLKEAILQAAEEVGEVIVDVDKKTGTRTFKNGKGGLLGYLRHVARNDLKSFSGLLGKVLPMQITGEGGGPVQFERLERVIVDPEEGTEEIYDSPEPEVRTQH